ncbi:MBL fold hydrolase [Pyrococcus furiosus DSM 3638]|uniref:MBL fold hydrolase n=3 Tax=Pyrococcus furiosus TaxID=2261 RepID=A0A5C0XNM5_PYRFU|nr:FprA family A-type flavoprotein [Pyrococcus furiosus]AAL80818.1 flavoprotein [Pyrococcus furiosus DSM 3638]AFN03487.1 flavoprotein [Pyrococcus furiosus COM1]QEK78389.1 MBL fold hydrolase [Pyrococcus furiosus DSM 3638]
MKSVKLLDGVYWVGVKDWSRRIFDSLIPLPEGTSYNAYLVVGNEKSALIDTVNPGFERELEEKVSEIVPLKEIDYVVMNHAEPDHAGAIPYIMERNKKALLITTEKGKELAKAYYNVPDERIIVVKDGDEVDLGGKTLRFIEAPWLHWPETMFTYLVEDKVLFPCDFFGAHTAHGLYDDEVPSIIEYAQRYFGEIMMPFAGMAKRAMEKLKGLEIKMIAPSHGPIYRNPERILKAYESWVNGETREKVLVAYVSMWGSNREMAKELADLLVAKGIDVKVYDLVSADIGELAKDLVDSRAIVLAAPTVLGSAHPLAVYAAYLVKALRPPAKYAVLIGSHGWHGRSIDAILEILKGANFEVLGTVDAHARPKEEDYKALHSLADLLAKKVRGE